MNAEEFAAQAISLKDKLAKIFRYQGAADHLGDILTEAMPTLKRTGYDNFDGGTDLWTLYLDIPLARYATLGSTLAKVERSVRDTLTPILRRYPGHAIEAVEIHPGVAEAAPAAPDSIARVWPQPGFKLFISHVSAYRSAVVALKSALAPLGITAFVAHKDIKPTMEWLGEIEAALKSMQALLAIVTPDYHDSLWTDQEVGWAMGRGLRVLAVAEGAQPYGFAGKWQSIPGSLSDPQGTAAAIASALRRIPAAEAPLRAAAVTALAEASSFQAAKGRLADLKQFSDFTQWEKNLLWNAMKVNSQVRGAYGVPEGIKELIGEPPVIPARPAEADDDIPF